MTEIELKNPDNWVDFGISDHIESGKFTHWVHVAKEIARIAECEPGSPMEDLFLQCAASAARLGFDCSSCGEICAPLNVDDECPKFAAKHK